MSADGRSGWFASSEAQQRVAVLLLAIFKHITDAVFVTAEWDQ